MEPNTTDNTNKYLSLKSEKLASAAYAITDFLSDHEPLKWRLRDKSLILVSDSLVSPDGLINHDRISLVINELVALLEVGGVGGAVSQMNLDILKQEYLSLSDWVRRKSTNHHLLTDYAVDGQDRLDSSRGISADELLRVKTKESSASRAIISSPLTRNLKDRPKDSYQGQGYAIKDNTHHVVDAEKNSSKKGSRQNQIVLFIKDKGWMSINEIAAAVSGCSLKTIQRELVALVGKGILHKHGERRWSKYILVT